MVSSKGIIDLYINILLTSYMVVLIWSVRNHLSIFTLPKPFDSGPTSSSIVNLTPELLTLVNVSFGRGHPYCNTCLLYGSFFNTSYRRLYKNNFRILTVPLYYSGYEFLVIGPSSHPFLDPLPVRPLY